MSRNGANDLKAQFEAKYARSEPDVSPAEAPLESCYAASCDSDITIK